MSHSGLRNHSNPWDSLTGEIIGAAIEVHQELGPGLLESAYEASLAMEFQLRRIEYLRQVELPVIYKGRVLNCGYRIDFVVGPIVVELKTVDHLLPVHKAQIMTYLRLKRLPVGLLLNFRVPTLREGIIRIVL